METTQEARPADIPELLNRQTGIRSFEKFASRANEHQPDEVPKHAENALEGLSRGQVQKWRDTGKLPAKDASRAESAETTASRGSLSSDQKSAWNQGSSEIVKPPSDRAETSAEAAKPTDTPQTHDQRYQEFHSTASNDVELNTHLSNIRLDAERGTIVVHALADLPADTRRQVLQRLATSPDLQLALGKAPTREHVVAAIQTMANGAGQRALTAGQTQQIDRQRQQHNELVKRYPDAAEKVTDAGRRIYQDAQISPVIKDYLERSDILPHVLYALSKQEVNKFIQLARTDPRNAMKALVTLERETEQQIEASKVPPVTKAPKPVSEVGGRGTVASDPLEAEAKAHPGKLTRAMKAEADRQYAARNR